MCADKRRSEVLFQHLFALIQPINKGSRSVNLCQKRFRVFVFSVSPCLRGRSYAFFFSTFAHVSFSATVRLNTSFSAVVSGSTQK